MRVPSAIRDAARTLKGSVAPPPLPPDDVAVVIDDDVDTSDSDGGERSSDDDSSDSLDAAPHPPRLPSTSTAPPTYEATPLDHGASLPPALPPSTAALPWQRDLPPGLDSNAAVRFQGFHGSSRSQERFLRLFGDFEGVGGSDRLVAEFATQTRCRGATFAGSLYISSRFVAFAGTEFKADAPAATDDGAKPMRTVISLLDVASIQKARIASNAEIVSEDDRSSLVALSRAGTATRPLRLFMLPADSSEFSALLVYTTTHIHVFAGFSFPENVYTVLDRCWRRLVDRRGSDSHPLKAQLLASLLASASTERAIGSPAVRSPFAASPTRSPALSPGTSPPPARRPPPPTTAIPAATLAATSAALAALAATSAASASASASASPSAATGLAASPPASSAPPPAAPPPAAVDRTSPRTSPPMSPQMLARSTAFAARAELERRAQHLQRRIAEGTLHNAPAAAASTPIAVPVVAPVSPRSSPPPAASPPPPPSAPVPEPSKPSPSVIVPALTLPPPTLASSPVSPTPSTPYGGIPGHMSRAAAQDAADGARSPPMMSPRTSFARAAALHQQQQQQQEENDGTLATVRKMEEELAQLRARIAQMDNERTAAAANVAPAAAAAPSTVDFFEPLVDIPAATTSKDGGKLQRLKSLLRRRNTSATGPAAAAATASAVAPAPKSGGGKLSNPSSYREDTAQSIAADLDRVLNERIAPPPSLLAFALSEPPSVALASPNAGASAGVAAAATVIAAGGDEPTLVAIDVADGFDADEWSDFERRRRALMAAGNDIFRESGGPDAADEPTNGSTGAAAAAAGVAGAAAAAPVRFVPLPQAQGTDGYLPALALSQMRTELANRLVMQEQDYVIALQVLLESYMQPCLSDSGSQAAGCVPDALLRQMFANVPALLVAHRALLKATSDALEELSRRGGRLLLERLPTSLALVRTYVANLPHAKAAYNAAVADKRFVRFVRRTFATSGQELADLMLEPMRMLFVYRSLLYSWLSCSPATHTDRPPLIECYRRVNDTLDHIHELDKQMSIFPDQWLAKLAKQHT